MPGVNVPDHYTISFSNNITMLLQIQGSMLRSCVTEGHYTGEKAAIVDQIGPVEMQDVTLSRKHAPTQTLIVGG
jgi:tRNA A-37 threonylcarbamoyl transferase component Bud32